uniref:NodB homology domain-containing protein n=1 Tax=Magnetococcus massalia (strain MO-1) TaxID=451514 RepID=A0A1S7LGU8_MAGMO|nr:protein of unknown function [Candidatus Magnetococcus massalia]
MDLLPVTVDASLATSHPLHWAAGVQVHLPSDFVKQHCVAQGSSWLFPAALNLDHIEALAWQPLRELRAYTPIPPTSSRLPISYQRIPPRVRSWIASLLGRRGLKKLADPNRFPGWPLDLSSDFAADCTGENPSLWREGATPVILSHDLDSQEGVENLERWFLELEERYGARSMNYVVACGWQLDRGQMARIKARGHELGIHGYDHANRTAFVGAAERQERLDAMQQVAQQIGATGYRAPSLLRTPELLAALAGRYRHDSTIPTAGGLFPMPDNGSATARPYWLGELLEIPLSMPRDGSLRFLGHSPEQISQIWIHSAQQIARSGGVVVLLTHCEERFSGNPEMLSAYEAFLAFIAESDTFAFSSMGEIETTMYADKESNHG